MYTTGSLYFKEDVSPELQDWSEEDNQCPSAQKSRIGPIVDKEWWRGRNGRIYKPIAVPPEKRSRNSSAARKKMCSCCSPPGSPRLLIIISPFRTLDMSGSDMLNESPEEPSITCFLDWQGAIVAPIFMQASIPALLAYTDDVFKLDSE
ncbi:uncharacterized protein ARMOST_02922 [Armillaria ostoyae]|uniref:Uncharacterized protein n=1 Tax=Armillaria ostoyae TaxID=47428 RepID=A0A284QSZ6_ARMOS|nr:uncharacterized protein ARMOST_02922 [Armillaria ostoyae]